VYHSRDTKDTVAHVSDFGWIVVAIIVAVTIAIGTGVVCWLID
jgi:hypothetical protein